MEYLLFSCGPRHDSNGDYIHHIIDVETVTRPYGLAESVAGLATIAFMLIKIIVELTPEIIFQ